MHAHQQQRAENERRSVERERLAGTNAQHERGGEQRPDQEGQVRGRLAQRLGVLDAGLGHGLRDQARVRGLEERLGGAEPGLDQDDVPEPHGAGENEHGQRRVKRGARQVGGDHDPVAGQAIRPHAAEQQQHHERQRLRSEHQSEVGRRPGAQRDEQRQRHDDDAVADHAGRLAEEQISEVLVAQNA